MPDAHPISEWSDDELTALEGEARVEIYQIEDVPGWDRMTNRPSSFHWVRDLVIEVRRLRQGKGQPSRRVSRPDPGVPEPHGPNPERR